MKRVAFAILALAALAFAQTANTTASNGWFNVGGAQSAIGGIASGVAWFTSFALPLILIIAWGGLAGWRLLMHRTVFEAIANPALAPLIAYMVIWFVVVYLLPAVSPNLYSIYQSAVQAAGRGFFPTG
ncbi:MAG: hypothetical protein QXU93_08055 [Thermoproteus sp.]